MEIAVREFPHRIFSQKIAQSDKLSVNPQKG